MNIIMNIILLEATTNISEWGNRIKELIMSIIIPIAVGLLAWNILPLIVKKDWVKIFTTVLLGGIALYFVRNPEFMGAIAKDIVNFLKGGQGQSV